MMNWTNGDTKSYDRELYGTEGGDPGQETLVPRPTPNPIWRQGGCLGQEFFTVTLTL